jgi:hypothetical protein
MRTTINIFDGSQMKWYEWREQFEAVMAINRMLDILLPDKSRPAEGEALQRTWDDSNIGVYSRLILYTKGTPLGIVKKHRATRDGSAAWKALVAKYEARGEVTMSALHEELISNPMSGSDDPEGYFLRIEELRERLGSLSVTIEDQTLKGIATARMPKEYANLRTVLDTIKDLTYDGLKEHVKAYHDRNIAGKARSDDSAFAVSEQQRMQFRGKCWRCKKFGHRKEDCRAKIVDDHAHVSFDDEVVASF